MYILYNILLRITCCCIIIVCACIHFSIISHTVPSHWQVDELSCTSESGSLSCREFEQYLLVSHYLATRSACSRVPQLNGIVAKISVSLLQHTDIIPADRVFYQAGMYCKVSE